jgi:hypothetical protein
MQSYEMHAIVVPINDEESIPFIVCICKVLMEFYYYSDL